MTDLSNPSPAIKKGLASKLSRINTKIWLIAIIGLFLIVMFPLVTDAIITVSKQHELRSRLAQLQTQHQDLLGKLAAQSDLTAQIEQSRKNLQALKTNYGSISQNLEVSRGITDLAWNHNITVNSIAVTSDKAKVVGLEMPVLRYTLALSGQVASFQNFILALSRKYKSGEILRVDIAPAQTEGELDKCTVVFQIYCNKDS